MNEAYVIVGGAGFIGSHFVDSLLASAATRRVTIFDNFSSGREWHYAQHRGDLRLSVIRADVHDLRALASAVPGHDTVIHLASNPDIARAATDPTIDFTEGTELTNNVVEAARLGGAQLILYASGSGVYGDLGPREAAEDHGPLVPISTYGASKLAGEAIISAYAHMFDRRGYALRFGNVVGRRQTHGVGYDFLHRLLADPCRLRILGDGQQSKPYVHVEDVVEAALLVARTSTERFAAFNVATGDYVTVDEIADLACRCLGLSTDSVRRSYAGGDRGWKGDVPVVRLSTDRIRRLGWMPRRSSAEAVRDSLAAMLPDIQRARASEGGQP